MSDYLRTLSAPPDGRGLLTISTKEKITRQLKSLPAFCIHSWRLSTTPFKLLALFSLLTSGLLIFTELRLREALSLRVRSDPHRVIMGRRTTPCTLKDPCVIQLVADLDVLNFKKSPKPHHLSKLITGRFWMDQQHPNFQWINNALPQDVVGKISEEGRGMELSELVLWNNQLLSFDDRTGIVYELLVRAGNDVVPMTEAIRRNFPLDVVSIAKYILAEEPDSQKGMKIEWACEVDGDLYVGSFGKEFTTQDGSKITSEANFWIVRIRDSGVGGTEIERINWKSQYQNLRLATETTFPGYLIHEAVNWSHFEKKWYFLPRRVSKVSYDAKEDETRGSNIMIITDSSFRDIEVRTVKYPKNHPRRGFSSLKFLPGTRDKIIIALRSEEDETKGEQRSYLSMFTTHGQLIMDEVEVSSEYKFEGVEIW